MVRKMDIPVPTPEEARRMYRRVMASWVQDLMKLRQQGADTPRYRASDATDADWLMPVGGATAVGEARRAA